MIYVTRIYVLNNDHTLHTEGTRKFSIKNISEAKENLFVIDDIIANKLNFNKNYNLLKIAQLIDFKDELIVLFKNVTDEDELSHLEWIINRLEDIITNHKYCDKPEYYSIYYGLEIV